MQACELCQSHLLQQWATHQSRNTPHAERHYVLRKRPALPAYDTTTFICYACGLEYPSTSLRLLYCRPNAENEPYYPYLENLKGPPGSSPISPQGTCGHGTGFCRMTFPFVLLVTMPLCLSHTGMVQVCAICFKAIPQRYKVFGITGVEASAATLLMARSPINPPIIRSPPQAASTPPPNPLALHPPVTVSIPDRTGQESPDLPLELCCYVCHRTCATESMKMLCCYPPGRRHSISSNSSGASPHRVMHFPFLKTLPKPVGPAFFDNANNRTLVCSECFAHFQHQWLIFESDGLALELRHYTLPPVVSHRPLPRLDIPSPRPSPPLSGGQRVIESGTLLQVATPNKQPSATSPNMSGRLRANNRQVPQVSPSGGDRRPPSSHSSSWTPPAATPALMPSPAAPDAPRDSSSNSTSDTSIYCYLCGLNSTRSFAHWLPSAPSATDPAAPYFPYISNYESGPKAEALREDGAAMVCTFCYHMVPFPF